MRRVSVSAKVAEKVSRYKTGGFSISSAEGSSISRSQKSLEEGRRLSEITYQRLRRLRQTESV